LISGVICIVIIDITDADTNNGQHHNPNDYTCHKDILQVTLADNQGHYPDENAYQKNRLSQKTALDTNDDAQQDNWNHQHFISPLAAQHVLAIHP
jgi:hypothetical protein